MENFRDAQTALAAFDHVHWEHKPGISSLRHTALHLMVSAAEGIKPALLVEHAARIANNRGMDIEAMLLSDNRFGNRRFSDSTEWIHEIRLTRFYPRSEEKMLLGVMSPLLVFLERVDHCVLPPPIEGPTIVRDMLEFAVVLPRPATFFPTSSQFLVCFEERLEYLWQKFGRTPARAY